jgi:hypothetical protein
MSGPAVPVHAFSIEALKFGAKLVNEWDAMASSSDRCTCETLAPLLLIHQRLSGREPYRPESCSHQGTVCVNYHRAAQHHSSFMFATELNDRNFGIYLERSLRATKNRDALAISLVRLVLIGLKCSMTC